MKIAAIDVFQVDLPYSGGSYALSGGRVYTKYAPLRVMNNFDARNRFDR